MNQKYKVLISIILISIYAISIVSAGETITVTGNIGTGVEGCKNLKGDDGKVYYLIYNKNLPPDGTHVTITGTMVNPGYNFCMVGDMLQVSSIRGDWQLIDNNPITRKIVTKTCNNCEPNIYQLHNDGTIWKYTGTPITGWQLLDNNLATIDIQLDEADHLYQLHNDGTIWKYTGTPCQDRCSGWQLIDENPSIEYPSYKTISIVASGSSNLYKLRTDGTIWKYTGTPITGWQLLDNNPATKAIFANDEYLYQLHNDGKIWQYTGTPCQDWCSGWQLLDNNPKTTSVVASGGIASGSSNLFQLHNDGAVYRYIGTPITGWVLLDNNFMTAIIAGTEGYLYQLHFDGTIWQYTGSPWWKQLDNHQSAISIVTGGSYLYQLRSNGEIWKYVNFD